MRFILVMLLAKLSRIAINIIDKSRGTDFPGKLALKLYKNFNSNFKKIDYGKVIIVTGSNGKSTMTNLLCRVLEQNGYKVGANLKGSNMINGATTVFINNVTLAGRPKADYFIIEADERSFPLIYAAFPAKNVLINNIMQDQVHRNGEPDYIYQIIKKTLNKDMTLFLNNDEPRSKSYEDFGGDVRYFCAQKLPTAFNKDGFTDVTLPCPKCASKIAFDYLNLGNTGRFKCTGCGFSSEDLAADAVTAAEDIDFDAGTFTIRGTAHTMPYSAPVMMYNYAGASAVCSHWGLSDEAIARGMESFVNVAGRIETIPYGDKRIHYLRMKQENPETLQDALNAVAMDKGDKALVIGLCTLEERRPQWEPHYTNTYYAYESDFKPLFASHMEKVVCFSEYVCYDIANRMRYDGIDEEKLTVINSDKAEDVFPAIDACAARDIYVITLMYQMNDFKKYIAAHGRKA